MLYKSIFRAILFRFSAENAHNFTFWILKYWLGIPFIRYFVSLIYRYNHPLLQKELFGIKFRNPVGLAAGLDKNAIVIDELAAFGFGFIEIGTLTPKAQPGNPKPRMFRLINDEAIINRMGFNNKGVHVAVDQLKKVKSKVIIGGNIGKNKVTPNEEAARDYEYCFEALYEHVDYFVINVSSPNTPNLRELQDREPLTKLINRVQERNGKKPKSKPVLLKIAPDLTDSQLDDIIAIYKETGLSGIIATNTTIARTGLTADEAKIEKIGAGGLSGKPVFERSNEVVRYLRQKAGVDMPIIGVGGIHGPEDAIEKIKAGADLVQVYSGFIYEGPALVKRIKKGLKKYYKQVGKA